MKNKAVKHDQLYPFGGHTVSGPALGMGRGGLSPPKRLSCPPNQNVGKDSVTHFYDLCID